MEQRATGASISDSAEPSRNRLAEAIREAERSAAAAAEHVRRFEALDAATVAIAQELSLERVLQLIVDSVRPLVAARYAALGIPDERGTMERFITSGISESARRAVGHPPRGHGLLGDIIEGGRSLRVTNLAGESRSAGFPDQHPPMRSFLGVPIHVEGRAIGNLYLTDKEDGVEFGQEDERLVESFARHAGLAIHNARLHEELRQMAVLKERERIAQDLHDGSIQSLYAVSLSLEDSAELLETEPEQLAERIDHAIESIHETIRGIREFIMGLNTDDRTAVDLLAGLAELADEFERSTLIEVQLSSSPDVTLDADGSLQLIQLTREAMSNVARHAEASSVSVNVENRRGKLWLSIIDDGRGFDTTEGRHDGHHGLTNMRARADSLGGSLTIESSSAGTSVIFQMPRRDDDERKESSR
ncbi:MAG: GAF domain-containing protein [Chloroflexota bacterium]